MVQVAVPYPLLLLVFFLGGARFCSLEADDNKKRHGRLGHFLDALPRGNAAAVDRTVDQLEFVAA